MYFMWTNEQKSAIDKRNSNILVSASAGSGKTAVLISRVIKRVLEDEIDIDKILVVTFTNASASELKDRLLSQLKENLKNDIKKSSFIKRQIRLLNRANISTIHSFCLKVIRENFDIIGIDPDFKICDDSQSNMMKVKALNKILEDEYGIENNSMLFKLLQLFNYKEEELSQELLTIYSYIKSFSEPFEWLRQNIYKYNDDCSVLDLYDLEFGKNIFDNIICELNLIISKLELQIDKLKFYEEFDKIRETLICDKEKIECAILNSKCSFDKLYECLNELEFNNMPRYTGENLELKEEITNFRKSIVKENIKSIKKSVYASTNDILHDNKIAYSYLEYIMKLLYKFEEVYSSMKLSKNMIDFSDIEHLTYSLLYKDNTITDIALKLKENICEVYTDEYQDTSYIQESILNLVSSSNNRFMVGDIKQSIYRFRQASPDIFNKKYNEYKMYDENIASNENTKIILAKNFRSREQVISSINYIFERIMSKEAGDCNYSGIDILQCGAQYKDIENQNYKTEINIIDLKQEENVEQEDLNEIREMKDFEIECSFIANKICDIVKNVKLVKNNDVINCTYKDIVILLRNVTNRSKILEEALKANNIPVFSDVSSSIFDSEEVKLVLSFLRVLDNKYQDIYLVSIMYSVIGMFNLDELVNIRNCDKKCSLYDCLIKYEKSYEQEKSELYYKLNDFLELINKYENLSKTLSIAELVIKLYQETGIYYQFTLDDNAKQKKANLDLILDMAIKFEKENGSGLSEYISYIDNLANKVDSSSMSAKVIGENENVVRIMTIHKSKGLEFPIVILADSSRKYNFNEIKNKIVLNSSLGIGINIVNEKYNISYPSVIKQAIKSQIVKESKNEELRLLYVAMTRAKEKLFVFGTVKDYFKLKSNLCVTIKKDGKVDPYVVLKNDSYLKNILMALSIDENYKNYFDFNLIMHDKNRNYIDTKISTDIDKVRDIKQLMNKYKKEEIAEYTKKIIDMSKLTLFDGKMDDNLQRISVSELKKDQRSELSNIKFEYPSCILTNGLKLTPARKGTLIHFILQILDIKNISTKQEISEFIEKSQRDLIISEDDKKCINVNDIYNFLNSKLGKKIKMSSMVEREKEFTLKNNSFSRSIIQGIIDLYFVNDNDKIILVDFKTDNLENEIDFINLYEKQLKIYKEAIEILTKKSVEKMYIYSFKMGREIEVN